MCRKNYLHGCCLCCLGLGLLLGRSLESWFACFFGGLGLLLFGFCVMGRK